MNQRLFLAIFFLLVLLMAVLVLAFLTIPPRRSIVEVQKGVDSTYELDYSNQFGPLTIITKLPAGTTTRTDVFDASGNKVY